ncbi:MAG: hypothetical protein BGO49_05570 [Planctomycetales bacterium 71-10]|nr:MAG: hypothetical protein BGO49_05570 [Planctomycetales bacterium 71-10]
MPRTKAAKSDRSEATPEAGWRAVRWEDLEGWAGKKAVERGKTYQEEGRVENLAVTKDGDLLATVSGTDDYSTHVWLEGKGDRRRPESMCTCPVGYACKHAVATVVEYLKAIAAKREVPQADEDDPRWYDLDEPADEGYEDEPRPKRSRLATKEWDGRIRAHLQAMPQGELVETIWAIAKAAPEVYEGLRERVALQDLDPAGLVAEARREIKAATSVDPWRSHWDGEGELPDYRPAERVLRRLLEIGRADDVVALGRDLIKKGFRQVERSDDEGETVARLRRALAVVFEAVLKSSLPGPDRLMFTIDACLDEPLDVVDDAADAIFDAASPTDWAAAADVLSARLKALPAPGRDDYEARDRREVLADWFAEALEKAGREGELPALFESEARATGEREPLIAYLIDEGRLDDAEREAREALADKVGVEPGTASRLAKTLADLAARRRRWDVVAAHAAREFFNGPTVETFKALLKAAKKAGVEPAARAGALHFLRTGHMPYEWVESKSRPKPKAGKKPEAKPAEPSHLKVDPAWPLPVPDEVVALLRYAAGYAAFRPHVGVLIDIALDEGAIEQALDYYDALKIDAGMKPPIFHEDADRYADRLAEAATAAHPDRALKIYKAQLDRSLPIADPSAYERSARLLARMRPIHEALGRPAEWADLVASAREKYRNRPRFLEQLDRTLGRAAGKGGARTS